MCNAAIPAHESRHKAASHGQALLRHMGGGSGGGLCYKGTAQKCPSHSSSAQDHGVDGSSNGGVQYCAISGVVAVVRQLLCLQNRQDLSGSCNRIFGTLHRSPGHRNLPEHCCRDAALFQQTMTRWSHPKLLCRWTQTLPTTE